MTGAPSCQPWLNRPGVPNAAAGYSGVNSRCQSANGSSKVTRTSWSSAPGRTEAMSS
ncbi:hypothetical protein SGLAM104S_01755 [Streptomyces glaucescens]